MLVILFLNAILIPYNIAFLSNEFRQEHQGSFRWFFAFSDVWFILDILLTFRTGKFSGLIICNTDKISVELVFHKIWGKRISGSY